MTSTCTPTFTGLPHELRDQIYSYLVPAESHETDIPREPATSSKAKNNDASNKCTFRLGMFGGGARRRASLCPEYFDLLPLLKTNRQLYLEVLPLWFRHNVVDLKDDSMQLRNTVKWFKAIAPIRLRLVKIVNVRVIMRSAMGHEIETKDILMWLKLEEEVLPEGIKVAFLIDQAKHSEVWVQAYYITKRCRKCGMLWGELEKRMRDMQKMLATLGWATESPEASEDEEEDSDGRDEVMGQA